MRSSFVAATAVAIAALFGLPAVSDDARSDQPAAAQDKPAATADDIAALVKQLDDDAFDVREAAGKRLVEIGAPAVAKLIETAGSDSPEASLQAFEVLRKQATSKDSAAAAAAKTGLGELAKSNKPTTAKRANDVLQAVTPKPPVGIGPRRIIAGGGGVGRIEIRTEALIVGGEGRTSISTSSGGGVTKTEVSEPGRTISIVEDADGITVESVRDGDGRGGITQRWTAKNAEELEKKHPDGHTLYKKFAPKGGTVSISTGDGKDTPAEARSAPRFAPDPATSRIRIAERMEESLRGLEARTDEIRRRADTGDLSARAELERLEAARRSLEDARRRIER